MPGEQAPDGTGAGTGGEAGSQVAGYAAVRLLADRAAAVRPGFTVNETNAGDVARICRALDGMPLAIELAAARLRTLSAAQLAERLDARFELLTGGSRTVPRHETLRAVVDWSWELLSGPEQVLARRLATFPAGATLAAVEQVCQDGALAAGAVLPAIFGLVEKSFLTVAEDDEPRYRMLETIRAYCAERLAEAGEEDQVRLAFAGYFLRLAETGDPILRSAGQQTWMRRLTAEQDNMYAALRWAVDRRDVALALRFGQALSWFWLLRGQRREAGTMAREILAISTPAAGAGRDIAAAHARAVCALTMVNFSWDLTAAREPLAGVEYLITMETGAGGAADGGRPPHPLVIVGAAMLALYEKQDPDLALGLLSAHFDSPDPWIRAGARLMCAFYSMSLGRLDDVTRWCAEGLAGFEALGDRWGTALACAGAGRACHARRGSRPGDRRPGAGRGAERGTDRLGRHRADVRHPGQVPQPDGDYEGALADMARAQRAAREQGESESDLWISYIQAELAWLRGDLAECARISSELDAQMASKGAPMIWSFRAQAINREAVAGIRTGNVTGGRARLAEAFRLAADSQDLAAVAIVMDGIAAAMLWTGTSRSAAERAAVLLGAAHSMRGAFDHSSLDAPEARDTARQRLGEADFDGAYQRGRSMSREKALALAEGWFQPSASA